MNISGLNGTIKADVGLASSYYSKNALGKFTDKNMLDSILSDRPQEYDKIIKLFTMNKMYSNDFMDLVMQGGSPFFLNAPDQQWDYKINKYCELPKIMVNLADTTIKPGIDGSEFELVFDKKVFVINDIITASRMNQEVQIQIASEPTEYQNYFKYTCRAIGKLNTDFVHQNFIQPGTEYMKMTNRIGEYTRDLSTLGLIDGQLSVTTEGLMEYGVEHTMTEYARLKKISTDRNNRPLDITYYSVTGQVNNEPINLTAWEPTIVSLLRMEMIKMKANTLMWGRSGNARDENGRPLKVYAGLWEQLHLGNVVYYPKGGFTMNIIRYTLEDLFNQRVAVGQRKARVYTNSAGMLLVNKALLGDALGMGFTFNAENYVKGKNNLSLGFTFGFDSYHSRETGDVEFVVLEQLNEAVTQLEQGPNKRLAPVFIIMNLSGGTNLPIRELKLASRPNGLSAMINGVTGFRGTDMVMAASKDPFATWQMKDFTGIFLEDPTSTVLIKETPQI